MPQDSKTRTLVECAILTAVAVVLSAIPAFKLPFGGTVSWFATVPVLVASMRHGPAWGVPTALVYSFIQLFMGLQNFSYLPYPKSVFYIFAAALLDYIIAFTIIGLAGIIFGRFKNQTAGIIFAVLLTGLGRFTCSFFSGILIWGRPDDVTWTQSLPIYSLGYNAGWCVPDVILALAAVLVLTNVKQLNLFPNKNA